MKNTQENRQAVAAIIDTARESGYEITSREYGDRLVLRVSKPEDTDAAIYPEIHAQDDWYGTEEIGFEITTVCYSDHSLAQAKRVNKGLGIAIDLVEKLLTTAEVYGLATRR